MSGDRPQPSRHAPAALQVVENLVLALCGHLLANRIHDLDAAEFLNQLRVLRLIDQLAYSRQGYRALNPGTP
jgi:hypothetical protein